MSTILSWFIECKPPPPPALQVATSDGVLRLYTFGRMDSAAGGAAPCIVAPPQPLPAPPVVAAAAAPSAGPAPAAPPTSAEAQAAGTALPDEGSEFEEVGLECSQRRCERRMWRLVSPPGACPKVVCSCGKQRRMQNAGSPVYVALQEEEEEEAEEEEEEEGEVPSGADAEARAAATALPEESDFEVRCGAPRQMAHGTHAEVTR